MVISAWIELVGGFTIAFGLFTRLAAFISSGEMAFAYYLHASGAMAAMSGKPPLTPVGHIFPILNGGEAAVLYCWIFLFVFFHGPGPWSVDALIGRNKPAAATP